MINHLFNTVMYFISTPNKTLEGTWYIVYKRFLTLSGILLYIQSNAKHGLYISELRFDSSMEINLPFSAL